MKVLLTGVGGFIGFHVARALCAEGVRVLGVDNLNPYYDVALKEARLKELAAYSESGVFSFHKLDIADQEAMAGLVEAEGEGITHVVHLAAQAGVRYSLTHPFDYASSNLVGQLVMLELCRGLPALQHFVYASSSSVYGANTELPFSEAARVEKPVSLYAATKRSGELLAYSYSHLYQIPMTGLRFFTVYGPWGRPDMAYFSFTKALFDGTPITVFGQGQMQRDFTYIDDVVAGVTAAMQHVPKGEVPYALFNLGNDKSEALGDFIAVLEQATGREAVKELREMQPGDMRATHADITRARAELGYDPKTTIAEGLPRFVEWYRGFYGE